MASNRLFPDFTGLKLQPDSTQQIDPEGLVTVQANYLGKLADITQVGAAWGTQHPLYQFVGVDSSHVDPLGDGVLGILRVTYKGVASIGAVRYQLQRTGASFPVEQCPDFATEATSANGAIFDDDGLFKGWKKTSKYAGITSIVAPQFAVTETRLLSSPDTSGTIGELTSIPGPFGVGTGIFMGASSDQLGGIVWRNVKTWQTMRVPRLANQIQSGGGGTGGGS